MLVKFLECMLVQHHLLKMEPTAPLAEARTQRHLLSEGVRAEYLRFLRGRENDASQGREGDWKT